MTGFYHLRIPFTRFLFPLCRRANDDTSVIILDLLPHKHTSFPKQVLKAGLKPERASSGGGGGGIFSACFKGSAKGDGPSSIKSQASSLPRLIADVDCFDDYPGLLHSLKRLSQLPGAGEQRRIDLKLILNLNCYTIQYGG